MSTNGNAVAEQVRSNGGNVTMSSAQALGYDGKGTMLYDAMKEWRDRPADQRFRTLAELKAKVGERRARSRAVDVDFARMAVADEVVDIGDGKTSRGLIINSVIQPSVPTHWSFGQLAQRVGAPAGYLRKLPLDLTVANLRHGIAQSAAEAVKFMTIDNDGDGPNTLQAVTSTTYGRIWDFEVVAAVERLVERTGGKFYNPKARRAGGGEEPSGLYASDRDVFVFMIDGGSVLDVGPRAKLNRGFIVKNSEVGSATFELITFLFNIVCGNHIIWGARDISKLIIRHTSGAPTRFDQEAAPTLMRYAESATQTEADVIRRAMAARIVESNTPSGIAGVLPAPVKDEEIIKWALGKGFTKGEARNAVLFAKAEEGQCVSVWDFVQGVTASARGLEWVDARTDLEKRAGALLKAFEG